MEYTAIFQTGYAQAKKLMTSKKYAGKNWKNTTKYLDGASVSDNQREI